MFPQSHCFVAMLVTSCLKDTCSNLSLYISDYSEGDEIVRSCDQHSIKTATLKKHVTKYKNMRKWMVEFLRKFENRGIKIARVKKVKSSIARSLPVENLQPQNVGSIIN